MRYLYLDESYFSNLGDFTAYGCLTTDIEIQNHIVESALEQLHKDPDRFDVRTKNLDDRTLKEKFFHASEDSKNAHSHICKAINENVTGFFHSHFIDTKAERSQRLTDRLGFLANACALEGTRTLDPVILILEGRSGLNKEKLNQWKSDFETRLASSIYDLPWLPAPFPNIEFKIADKRESGLQVVDFILWAVGRHKNGKSTWLRRLEAKQVADFSYKSGSEGGVDLHFGKRIKDSLLTYELNGINLDKHMTNEEVATTFLNAQGILNYYYQNDLPENAKHLRGDIEYLYYNRKNEVDMKFIEKLSLAFVKLFDYLELGQHMDARQREGWLLTRKVLALCLRTDLLHGQMTKNFLGNYRQSLIDAKNDVLDASVA